MNMNTKDDCESSIYCPECNKQMYALEGALSPIYVCSHCGASIDEKQLQKTDESLKNKDSDLDKPLLHDLFPGQFMKKYTAFDSFSDFINNCELFGESIQEINKELNINTFFLIFSYLEIQKKNKVFNYFLFR